MNVYRVGDIVAAFFAGALFIALIIRGIEIKRIIVIEEKNTAGAAETSKSTSAPEPQRTHAFTPKVVGA